MYLIFDFDGTLVCNFPVAIEILNRLAKEFNFNSISPNEVDELRHLTSREFLSRLNIPLLKLPAILAKARVYLQKEIHTLTPVQNLPQVLQALKNKGFSLGILTSNSKKNVLQWLQENKLQEFFTFVSSQLNLFGKAHTLKKILDKFSIDKSNAFYVGDETRDIEAAKKCRISSIAVTWGFNSEEVLRKHQPTLVINNPEELLNILK